MSGRHTGRREWTGLAVLALPCLLISMDASVLELAIPKISADLQPSSAQLLWIMDVYGFMLAGSLITMGALGDRIGRRRLLLTGAGAFGGVSVLAALSTSAPMLIGARALLGVAGATLMPSTLSLITTMFPDPSERTRAIGVWVACLSAGGALGPIVGGALLEWFWWGSVFLLAVPVVLPLLVLGPRLLPESRAGGSRVDLVSAAQSVLALLALVYVPKHLAQDGADAAAALAGAAAVAATVAFVRRQRRLADPLVDLRLFRRSRFNAAIASNLLGFFVLFGGGLFMAQYLQLVLGMGTFEAGLWMLPFFGGFVAGSMATPAIVRRVDPGRVAPAGIAVAAAGLAVVLLVEAPGGLALLVTGSVLTSLGLAPVFTLATDMIVGAAPEERAGSAAALGETSTELGGALGIAVLGSIGAAVYRADAPPAARNTLGGAAGELPARAFDAAAAAFTHGYHVAALSAAALLALAAAGATRALRPDPGR